MFWVSWLLLSLNTIFPWGFKIGCLLWCACVFVRWVHLFTVDYKEKEIRIFGCGFCESFMCMFKRPSLVDRGSNHTTVCVCKHRLCVPLLQISVTLSLVWAVLYTTSEAHRQLSWSFWSWAFILEIMWVPLYSVQVVLHIFCVCPK